MNSGRIVWSSDDGDLRRAGGRTRRPEAPAAQPPAGGAGTRVTVRLERAGRGGKSVTVADGPGIVAQTDLRSLAKAAKAACGTGGTSRDGTDARIELQGDHRGALAEFLSARGFDVRRGN
jgi:predicted translation initiation factor SUI1